ncbi:hypothetical protein [Rheinheimera sp. MMS21-TC3]|uniref:hypothetical protein n=1 Tax=Rheinheimera sp. MMS21-TC3 TaxID=3072790 RepID=UPI0028C4C29D|nr:hypothetical protein [Rheinheimera sp. MMS21-TC3]WNO60899.1 hypothetical protein RDV63_08020 [Rheinheimera sp. MMS21-TC3]
MLRTDLKIFKSERMTQQADAGGQRTSNEVQNGQLNEVVGNISDIDHAQSAVDIAKIYPAVSTANTDLLQDGHILINEPPLDPLVDVMIIESTAVNDGSTRADIINAIESSVVPSLLLRSGLSAMVAGQDQINTLDLTANAPTGEQPQVTLTAGRVYVISVEYTGDANTDYPRFTHFIKITEVGSGYYRFEPPLPYNTPGASQSINGQTRCTKLREITAGAGVTYHGVTQLTSAASGTELQVSKTAGRVTPRITEALETNGNQPFAGFAPGLVTSIIEFPAVGPTYSVPVPDFIQLPGTTAFVVSYISGGANWTMRYSNAALNGVNLEFTLPRIPDSDTNVQLSYYSSERYAIYNYPDDGAIPAGYSLVPLTVTGSVLRAVDNQRYTARQEDADPTRFNVWIYNATTNIFQLAVILDLDDGTPSYFNNYSSLQYQAILSNDEAAGESATTANFVMEFNEVLPDSFYMSVELVAGGLLSASSDANGDITGVNVTGTITGNAVNLIFAEQVKLSTLQYSINEVIELVPPSNLYGINPLRLPNGGAVQLYRPFGVICVAHNQYSQYPSLTPAQSITARPNSFIDIVDGEGASLWHPMQQHYEYDKDTGEVTIVNVAGFTAPFELVDTLSELALVTAVTDNTLKITAALKGTYPAGSVVSSVYQLGDLQARVTNIFDQTTWNGVWSDTIQGDPAPANYNAAAYPPEVTNESAINDRWAFIFTSDTAFRCIGKNVGQVGTGDTLSDFAPINPATGLPYFIIRWQGWGGGWQPGNVWFEETIAASKPAVLLRSVSAGHSAIDQDSIRLHFRGNAE